MRDQTKLAAIVIGWIIAIVGLIVLGIVADPLLLALAAGSVLTVPIMYLATLIGGRMIVQSASSRTETILNELQEMNDDVDE